MQWLAAVAAGALAAFAAGRLVAASGDKQLQLLWDDWPAWSATLLLILQPLQQLVRAEQAPDASTCTCTVLLTLKPCHDASHDDELKAL
jgi:hypothetical protein